MKKKCFWILLILFVPFWILLYHHHSSYSNKKSRKATTKSSEKEYYQIDTLEKLVTQDQKDGKPLMIGEENISEFLSNSDVQNKKWNVTTLTTQEIQDLYGDPNKTTKKETITITKTKSILYWNEAYGSTEYGFCCGQEPYERFKCKSRNCYVTNDRKYLPSVDQYDAILFHQRSLSKKDLPAKRSPHQRYIMYMMESASYPFGFVSSEWNGFFNWTMTFRTDSDFYTPYGRIEATSNLPENLDQHIEEFGERNKNAEYLSKKKRPVAWFVSNCDTPSNRMEYVKELQKHIDVDIYGKCGPLQCSRSKEGDCWKKVDEEYYFYLAFENSICKDYVTEKFFNSMNHSVIPISMGAGNYEKIAPKNSYIDAYQDFRSDPRHLATHLQDLIDDKAKYVEYFWWKDFYTVGKTDSESIARYQCQVCDKLNENPSPSAYEDLKDWWLHQSRCKKVHVRDKEK